jgi:hypothetical protein
VRLPVHQAAIDSFELDPDSNVCDGTLFATDYSLHRCQLVKNLWATVRDAQDRTALSIGQLAVAVPAKPNRGILILPAL